MFAPLPDPEPDAFRDDLLAHIPLLKAFGLKLAATPSEADDLVQEALARAWRYRSTYQAGTSMKSWLCRILQNGFYREAHRRRGTVEDVEGRRAGQQTTAAPQEWAVLFSEILSAIDRLTPDARHALLMVGAGGFSYEEAAAAADCPVGTLKSRVNRARERLIELTGADPTLN